MDCVRSRNDVVNLDIHCISCIENKFGTDTSSMFLCQIKSRHSSIVPSNGSYVSVALGIYCRWWTQARNFTGPVPDDLDLRLSMTSLITAIYRVDCR